MAKEHGEAAPEIEPNGRKRIPLATACEYRKESPLAAGGTSRPAAGELAGARVRLLAVREPLRDPSWLNRYKPRPTHQAHLAWQEMRFYFF
jgi:hypothetical protein